jgi:hypothetical protein
VDYIRPGSPADLSCKIFVGDEVVSMNGKSLHGMQVHFFFSFYPSFFIFTDPMVLVCEACRCLQKLSKRALLVKTRSP